MARRTTGASAETLDMMRDLGRVAAEESQPAKKTRQLRVDIDDYDHELLEAAARDAKRLHVAGASKRLMVHFAILHTYAEAYGEQASAVMQAKKN